VSLIEGDREDRAGHPFVGPAGRELAQRLEGVALRQKRVADLRVVADALG
jgi:uracil-DNA glycosylase